MVAKKRGQKKSLKKAATPIDADVLAAGLTGLEFVKLPVNRVQFGAAGGNTSPRFNPDDFLLLPEEAVDEDLSEVLAKLVDRGLFDAAWYRRRYADVGEAGIDPATHFLEFGAAEDRWPNFLFDPTWYRSAHMDVPVSTHPIVHYLRFGEGAGLRPAVFFDPAWYSEKYLGTFENVSPLGHYLMNGRGGGFDPNAYFDTTYYLKENPDVAASDILPFEHFLTVGQREGRNPSAGFNIGYYQRRYVTGQETSAFQHFLEIGTVLGNNPDPDREPAPAVEIRRFARPAPAFEPSQKAIAADCHPLAKLIGLYLPQFHSFPENDAWWGTGFTEWTNLSRGTPRFSGHYQPRVPRDLGFYDLSNPGVMKRQIEIARAAGLHGFCFYYYNFNGKRLLEAPLEGFLLDKNSDWPFCIMWANENWSRRWDGSESELLMRQDYREEDAPALVDDFARHFGDRRYIRVGGRPLFFVYRAGMIPNARTMIALWRELFWQRHGEEPLFFLAQTFTDSDPEEFGFDGAMEFPPHKILTKVHPINPKLQIFDPGFSGHVYQYEEVIAASLSVPRPDFPLIKTVFPSWDNDARRQGHGLSVTGSTPAKYQAWLERVIAIASEQPIMGESFVVLNAWNEWAEGAYLEPDVHFGWAYLNATARAVSARPRPVKYRVLVVADWGNSGTQHAVTAFADVAVRRFGCEVQLLLVNQSGPARTAGDFAHISTANSTDTLKAALDAYTEAGLKSAIVFGTSAGHVVKPLKDRGFRVVSVVGELPITIATNHEGEKALAIARLADVVVARSTSVLRGLDSRHGPIAGQTAVREPGPAGGAVRPVADRNKVLDLLGLGPSARLVVNSGPATMQAGADLFAAAARVVTAKRSEVAFIWFGDIDPSQRQWLEAGFQRRHLQFVPSNMGRDPLSVADVVAFSAREDAHAEIVSEAIGSGIPVVAFEGSGTGADMIAAREPTALAPYGDAAAFAARVIDALDRGADVLPKADRGGVRGARTADQVNTFALLKDADPTLQSISVVVLGDGREDSIRASLKGVLEQTHPVFEIIVLADGLSDREKAGLDEFATDASRDVQVVDGVRNLSDPGQGMSTGVSRAGGDLIWLVSPGAALNPFFLESTSQRLLEKETFAAWFLSRAQDRPARAGRRAPTALVAEIGDDHMIAELGAMLWRRSALADSLRGLQEADLSPARLILRAGTKGSKIFVTHGPLGPVAKADIAPESLPKHGRSKRQNGRVAAPAQARTREARGLPGGTAKRPAVAPDRRKS